MRAVFHVRLHTNIRKFPSNETCSIDDRSCPIHVSHQNCIVLQISIAGNDCDCMRLSPLQTHIKHGSEARCQVSGTSMLNICSEHVCWSRSEAIVCLQLRTVNATQVGVVRLPLSFGASCTQPSIQTPTLLHRSIQRMLVVDKFYWQSITGSLTQFTCTQT